MHIGVSIFLTDRTVRPDELARDLEERGLESLFVPEHTHIPTSRLTPYPAGGPLPDEYRRTLDPFVALTAASSVTERLRIGTAIALVAQRDPIHFAKEVASLDLLSGGRFVCGVGFGWNREELESHGVRQQERRAVVRERVLAAKELWTNETASFEGDHVRFAPSWQWPKPAQQPHPPVYLGGAGGPKLLQAVVDYADGWMPIGGSGLSEKIPLLRSMAAEAGRHPDSIGVSVVGPTPKPDYFEHLASIGVERAIVLLPSGGWDEIGPLLDRVTALVDVVA